MSVFGHFSTKSRQKKREILQSLFGLDESTRVLDVGGQANHLASRMIDDDSCNENITVINTSQHHLTAIKREHPRINAIQADARRLPFEDKSFDIVYSNAVIEHVGDWQDQMTMAREVMRVGKSWFITTPNRWFPFEFHTRLPFIGFLPSSLMRSVARMCSYNHVEERYQSGIRTHTRLLTAREMRRLFPQSDILHVRVTLWPETLIAAGPLDVSLSFTCDA